MNEIELKRPVFVYFYGFPGSGKSYVAKNLAQHLKSVLISEDKIRSDLFEQPRYTDQENKVVSYMMDYLAEQFLKAGISVIYDTNAMRYGHRRNLRSMAAKHKAENVLIWPQIDPDSAFTRTQSRDRRLAENRNALEYTKDLFNNQLTQMQNPRDESYVVVSGKHSFITQKGAILSK